MPKGLAHPALLGPLQVISRKAAARMVSAGLARWKSFYHPQEDVWLFNLLTALNVTLKVDLHPWVFPTWDKPSLPLSHCSCKIRQKETPAAVQTRVALGNGLHLSTPESERQQRRLPVG